MGTSPPSPIFEPGDDYSICSGSIFADGTPKYIEVHLENQIICPGFPQAPANGVYLLTQVAACQWDFNNGFWDFKYILVAGFSQFDIFTHPWFAFFHTIAAGCQKEFTNQVGPCGATNSAHSGTATMFWGPTIGP